MIRSQVDGGNCVADNGAGRTFRMKVEYGEFGERLVCREAVFESPF